MSENDHGDRAHDIDRRQILVAGAAAAVTMAGAQEAQAAGSFSDKVVLITGATMGLGRVTARTFAAEGARVYFCGLEEANGKALANEITGGGGTAAYVSADVRNDDDIRNLVATVARREGRLDIAVNNAAILGTLETAGSQTLENWIDVMATNAFGVHRSMHHEAPLIAEGGGGVIINVGATSVDNPVPGAAVANAAKAANHTLTRAAAIELKPQNIRVVGLLPGKMLGGMTDLFFEQTGLSPDDFPQRSRFEDVAADALWLASDAATATHGQLMDREMIARLKQ